MNFEQRVELSRYSNRFEYFENACRDKSVLHVGCSDPSMPKEDSLHARISSVCSRLDGLDVVDDESIRIYGKLFLDVKEIHDEYDLMIVPEVVEHVHNLALFFESLSQVHFSEVIVTAPNALMQPPILWNTSTYDEQGITEIVHPDHKCWFSPYTLKNCVQSFTSWRIEEVFLLQGSMVGVRARRS